jgi:hypothetical protein
MVFLVSGLAREILLTLARPRNYELAARNYDTESVLFEPDLPVARRAGSRHAARTTR